MLRSLSVMLSLLLATVSLAQEPRWLAPRAELLASGAPLPPCPLFRKSFTLDAAPAHATVRIVGLGHYELRLNAQRVGHSLIDQPWSEYRKTIFVQEFDLPGLKAGENVLAVLLGNSFWRVGPANDEHRFVKTDAMPDFSGGYPNLLWLDADLTLADGTHMHVVSDDSWRWADGPVTFSHIYAGEDFDARLDPAGWDQPTSTTNNFDATAWQPPAIVSAPKGALVPYTAPPIRSF